MTICADFGILDILRKHPSEISGGERQRVALARAAVADSRYYLLDEPFAALDVKTRYSVRTALKAALNRLAKPALIVTHDYTDALVLADRIAVMERGEITQIGTPGELHLHPRTEFTAALAGVNFYKGVCRESGVVEIGAARLRCAAEPAEEIFVSFLPSDVSLWRDNPQGSPRNVFAGRVTELIPYPGRSRVNLEAELPMVAEITGEAVQGLELKPGDTVYATVKAVNVRVYV
jgi:molybdate transport system ATP-binding protein